jgi:predicted DNA-binding transcriptional regulator AlpA
MPLVTLTETEVSRMFKCTKGALRRMRREGRGPRFIHIGRLVRYIFSDVEEFLKMNTTGGTQGNDGDKAITH